MKDDDIPKLLDNQKKVVGMNQARKAIENGEAQVTLLAADAEFRIIAEVREMCEKYNCKLQMYPSMKELGKDAGINVGASIVAVLK